MVVKIPIRETLNQKMDPKLHIIYHYGGQGASSITTPQVNLRTFLLGQFIKSIFLQYVSTISNRVFLNLKKKFFFPKIDLLVVIFSNH